MRNKTSLYGESIGEVMVDMKSVYLVYPEQQEHLIIIIAAKDPTSANKLAMKNSVFCDMVAKGHSLKFVNISKVLAKQGYEVEVTKITGYH